MRVVNVASSQSAYRGYEYYRTKKVIRAEEMENGVLSGAVSGSGENNVYEVTVDTEHPRRSQCNCPHAAGKQIVCKHMVAVYFTVFPLDAEKYISDLENYWEEEDARRQEREKRLVRYVRKMKKSELQEALLQLLFSGPEWQYDRFVSENTLY